MHQNFFELGGDSIAAMSLLARIVQETGHNVPVAGLLKAPTVALLALALRQESDGASWSPMVPIQTEGSKPPFFCVHPAGGNVLCYLRLSQYLGKDQPFYGLQAQGIDGLREPLCEVETMAAEYVEAVRRVQPHGPYALGGWSFGGVAAYEMGQRLLADGEEVRLLAILDSGVIYAFAVMTAAFSDDGLGLLDVLRMPEGEQLTQFRRRTAVARLIPEDADDALARRIYRVFVANVRAMLNYRAEPYPGKLTLFQGTEPFVQNGRNPYQEWSRLCDAVDLVKVPGNHLTLVHEPHLKQLAAELHKHLEAAAQA